jgi:hypothetical protein
MEVEIIKVDGRQYRKQPINMALYVSGRSDTSNRRSDHGKSREGTHFFCEFSISPSA